MENTNINDAAIKRSNIQRFAHMGQRCLSSRTARRRVVRTLQAAPHSAAGVGLHPSLQGREAARRAHAAFAYEGVPRRQHNVLSLPSWRAFALARTAGVDKASLRQLLLQRCRLRQLVRRTRLPVVFFTL